MRGSYMTCGAAEPRVAPSGGRAEMWVSCLEDTKESQQASGQTRDANGVRDRLISKWPACQSTDDAH